MTRYADKMRHPNWSPTGSEESVYQILHAAAYEGRSEEAIAQMLGRLIAVLEREGKLSPSEVAEVLGTGWAPVEGEGGQ